IGALLFKKNEQKVASKKQKQIDSKYEEVRGEIKVGDTVKMKRNLQVGEVLELRGKRAVVKIGLLPMQIDLGDLSLVKEKEAND
ncbi:MAG: MutS2/Smr-associated SH3 domain-containing protein, partial [Flavisolibacter sp.]